MIVMKLLVKMDSSGEVWSKLDPHRTTPLLLFLFDTRIQPSSCRVKLCRASLSVYARPTVYSQWFPGSRFCPLTNGHGGTEQRILHSWRRTAPEAALLVNILNHCGLLLALKRGDTPADALISESIYRWASPVRSVCLGPPLLSEIQRRLKWLVALLWKCCFCSSSR